MDAATGLVIGLPRRAPVPVHRRCTGSLALSHRLQQRFVHHSCNNARRRRLRSPRHLLCASLRISATGTVASPTSPPRAPRRTGVPQACVSRIAYSMLRIAHYLLRVARRSARPLRQAADGQQHRCWRAEPWLGLGVLAGRLRSIEPTAFTQVSAPGARYRVRVRVVTLSEAAALWALQVQRATPRREPPGSSAQAPSTAPCSAAFAGRTAPRRSPSRRGAAPHPHLP